MNALFEHVAFGIVSYELLIIMLSLYIMTNMQWYSYRLSRVIFKHHKLWWHGVYFLAPFVIYHLVDSCFWIYFYLLALPLFVVWYVRLDKRLVFTWRVRRFFIFVLFFSLFGVFICHQTQLCHKYSLFVPLFLAVGLSHVVELYLFKMFKKEAIEKIERLKNLKVIAVTGSYGKTSMKSFIVQLLSQKYKVYATPGNVNTLAGVVRDINEHLENDVQVYVVEAGARERGDIYAIAQLVHPHVAIVGKVGPQHIEYFKTLDNIIRTKMELIHSDRLEKAFIHTSVTNEPHEKVTFFGDDITHVTSHLNGMEFEVGINGERIHFATKVLGSFQSVNITAAVLVAHYMRIPMDAIKEGVQNLQAVPHRLEKIDTGVKLILDDSYNGNYEGMMEAISLASEHTGRKVIVTPGLVESSVELNTALAKRINSVFDVVIITGSLNASLFDAIIELPFKVLLEDKRHLESILQNNTQEGDIILFANDAPSFI